MDVSDVQLSVPEHTGKKHSSSSLLGSHPARTFPRLDLPIPLWPMITMRGSGYSGVGFVEGWLVLIGGSLGIKDVSSVLGSDPYPATNN